LGGGTITSGPAFAVLSASPALHHAHQTRQTVHAAKAIGKMRLASALSNGEDELAKTAQQGFPPHRAWFKEKSRLPQHLRAINLSAAEPVMGQL
jgi:hypothetical protein